MRRVRREESVVLSPINANLLFVGEWTSRIVHLLNDHHMGVVTAAASLIGRGTEQLVGFQQCCGSGIRCLFDPCWFWNGLKKTRSDPG